MHLGTLALLLSLVPGCGPEPAPVELQPAQEAPPPPPEPTTEERIEEALVIGDKGDHAGAVQALEALLPEHPDQAAIWIGLEREAVAAGLATELLDRLSVTDAIGGQAAQHHGLRAALALAAGRPGDALDAAAALRTADPAGAAAFRVMAIRAGATVPPEALDPATPEDALLLMFSAPKEADRRAALQAAAQVEGWRARLLRAEAHRLLGADDAARAELEQAASDPDPRAVLATAGARIALAGSPEAAAEIATSAARAAAIAHDGAAVIRFLEKSLDLHLQAGRLDAALTLAQELAATRPEGLDPVTGAVAALRGLAAWEAGAVPEAVEASGQALDANPDADAKRRAAWVHALAGWDGCDVEVLQSAAAALPEAEAGVVKGFEAFCTGDLPTAGEQLAPSGLPAFAAPEVALAAALAAYDQPAAVARAREAVRLADAGGRIHRRIQARLALERHARLAGDAAAARAALAEIEASLKGMPALQLEVYARRLVQGENPSVAEGLDIPAEFAPWRAFTDVTVTLDDDARGIGAWALARRRMAAGEVPRAAEPLRTAVATLPVTWQGRWAPLLALDGADGPALDPDAAVALANVPAGGDDVLLALHEFHHVRTVARVRARIGDDPTRAMSDDDARAFRHGAAREEAQILSWLSGTGVFPESRVLRSEKACREGAGDVPSVTLFRQLFSDTALFSIRMGRQSGEILVITPAVTRARTLDPAEIRRLAGAHLQALQRGHAFTGELTDPVPGDRLRHAIIDDHLQDLAGLARYLVVADPELLLFSWGSLPEQAEGRRYLADIRTVSVAPTLSPLLDSARPPEEGYRPDFYGAGIGRDDMRDLASSDVQETMLAAGIETPTEISTMSRHFGGGFSLTHQDGEATAEEFATRAGRARYVHLAGVPASADGGLAWLEGTTSLASIRCMDLHAQVVALSLAVDPQVQVARAEAFLRAGANHVLASMWNPSPGARTRQMSSFYDSLNRERTPGRALAEARELMVNDVKDAAALADPSYWGAIALFGAP